MAAVELGTRHPIAHATAYRRSGPFQPADLAPVRRAAEEMALRSGLAEPHADRFVLALSEALTNVISHAGRAGEVRVYVDGDQLVAEITDHGDGLDTTPVDDPPANHATHGRGLWLMRRCVDRVEIFRQDVGTRIRLVMALSGLTLGFALT